MPLRSDSENFALIRVIGIGGGGSNAVNRMIRAEMMGVEFIAVNTDAQALLQSDAPHKIRIGDKITRGLGAGGDPTIGQRAAEEDAEKIYEALKDSDMVFITAGMGGGTGLGRGAGHRRDRPRPGRADDRCRDQAVLLRGRPPPAQRREGRARRCKDKVDTLITIPNDRLKDVVQKDTSIVGCLPRRRRRAAPGRPGHQRPDHRARPHQPRLRRRAHDHEGRRLGADGHRPRARGENRAADAARRPSPARCWRSTSRAPRACCSTSPAARAWACSRSTRRPQIIKETADPEANIIFGTVIDERMGDEVAITVIATGFDCVAQARAARPPGRRPRRSRSRAHCVWRAIVSSTRRRSDANGHPGQCSAFLFEHGSAAAATHGRTRVPAAGRAQPRDAEDPPRSAARSRGS